MTRPEPVITWRILAAAFAWAVPFVGGAWASISIIMNGGPL